MIRIELDRIRHIRLTPNAIADAEAARKMGFIAMMHPINAGVGHIRTMLWAGLKWEDHSLTLEKTGDLMEEYFNHGGSFEELEYLVVKALDESGCYRINPEALAELEKRIPIKEDADLKNEE